ncbi:hypothetical protein EDB81DRAFT_480297 [Dactylonectria macrodidyma]|uniref:C2H2-type domain-containing protein n=1 Tax=Dactylonectria macrodidyma TaxID=307937 RepID=A0A9P9J3V4_9HYPO|nr:hypothetical protein EDB81DRAFT_480297 [Dactylonectria macrodidyma]
MASLKNIMNTEDDHVDATSGPTPHDSGLRQSLRSDSSASAPAYPTARDRPTTTASHNGMLDPTKISSRYYITEASSSSSSAGTASARRRSNASIDSTESPYGPAYSQPASNSPMRPFTTNMGNTEPRVKLTPITGKISKAKKGVPVHNCDQCPKTFTRAEHLRRHQLSHAAPDLRCHFPSCGKTFFRKDLLDRHLQRHEQDDMAKDVKPSSRRRSSKSSTHSYGNAPSESGLKMPEAFTSHQTNAGNDLPGTPGMAPSTWPTISNVPNTNQNHTSSPQMMNDAMGTNSKDYVIGPPMHDLPTTMEGFMPATYSQPRDMPELLLYIPDGESVAPSWQDNQTMPSSASESTYSTPSDNSRRHRFPLRASSGDWNTTAPYQAINETRTTGLDNGGYHIPFTYSASPPMFQQMYGDSMALPLPGYAEDNALIYGPDQMPVTTVRSLSPQMAVAQSSETLVTIPSVATSDHFLNGSMCGRQPTEGLGILNARDMMPVSLTRAIRDMVPAYLEVYWEKVHPLYPVVHRPSFENVSEAAADHVDVLRCAMAAIATQFLPDKDHRMKGAELHAYAWNKSKVFTQSDEWPLPVKQTVLLCEYYARFRGRRKESYRPSSRFSSLYQRVFNNQNAFVPITLEHDAMRQWTAWVNMETERRLLAACFLLDIHSARYHEQRHVRVTGLDYLVPHELPIPMSSSTAQLWEAATFQDWSVLQIASNPITLRDVNLGALTALDIASEPPFDGAILLAAFVLYLPGRENRTQPELVEDASTDRMDIKALASLFPNSAVANTYLALHYTPLRFLLSVSGDSWVFNEKVTNVRSFTEHREQLNQWRHSGSAAIATVFAARALKAFLSLDLILQEPEKMTSQPIRRQSAFWKDISDYWGVYVCALICWAFGDIGKRSHVTGAAAREAALHWIMMVADMEPAEVQDLADRHGSYEVVTLARAELAADCLGGRNILFADAAGVLEKLEHGDNWKWF